MTVCLQNICIVQVVRLSDSCWFWRGFFGPEHSAMILQHFFLKLKDFSSQPLNTIICYCSWTFWIVFHCLFCIFNNIPTSTQPFVLFYTCFQSECFLYVAEQEKQPNENRTGHGHCFFTYNAYSPPVKTFLAGHGHQHAWTMQTQAGDVDNADPHGHTNVERMSWPLAMLAVCFY